MNRKLIFVCILSLTILMSLSSAFAQDMDNAIVGADNNEIYISPSGTGTGSSSDDPTNWNSAYSSANDGNTIIFLNGTYTSLVNKQISKSIELRGSGNSVVDANNRTGFFTIYPTSTVTLNNLIIFNGETGDTDAGAIVNNGNLIVNNTFFSSSSGWGTEGGAIHNNGHCTIYDSKFFNNTAKKGGSIFVSERGYLEVYNTIFIKGSSKSGNCINVDGGTANIYGCEFVNCSARSSIVYVDKKSTVSVYNSSFSSSRAVTDAAAIYSKKESSVLVENCNFTQCNAVENGGAISTEGTVNILNSSFVNCSAQINGGAIYVESKGRVTVTDSLFISNTAAGGNHIYSEGNSVSLYNCTLGAENTLTTKNITSGETETVNVEIDEGTNFLSVNVNLILNNKTVVGNVNNDYSFDLKDLISGTYTVSLASKDNNNGNSYIYTVPESTFTVGSTESNETDPVENTTDDEYVLEVGDVSKYYHGPERLIVKLSVNSRPAAGENITILINGRNYTRTTAENGTTSMALSLNAGIYDVLTVYKNISRKSKITIQKTVNGSDITKLFRNSTQYYATFTDSSGAPMANKNVSFNINGVYYTRPTNENGTARLNINLAQGEYIITATNPENGEMSSNNITVLPVIIENTNLTKYYRNGSQYFVKVIGGDGNALADATVRFNINGMIYERTSGEDGIARININLQEGNYLITAEYNGCRVANSIRVLPVLSAENLVKTHGQTNPFECRVVDGKGNALADTDVTFNINGVFYTRTSNSDGIASLNINLQKGSYIITSSYNNSNIANVVTVN